MNNGYEKAFLHCEFPLISLQKSLAGENSILSPSKQTLLETSPRIFSAHSSENKAAR
jgi:hypothetical protein